MLGDQLITNERVALVEIIKNAYDADADSVKVTFSRFDKNYQFSPQSKIIIEDDGVGMTKQILTEHWVSPATPVKKIGKETTDATAKGRKIQGEKGIGRFAILKLGKTVSIVTQPAKGCRPNTRSGWISPPTTTTSSRKTTKIRSCSSRTSRSSSRRRRSPRSSVKERLFSVRELLRESRTARASRSAIFAGRGRQTRSKRCTRT